LKAITQEQFNDKYDLHQEWLNDNSKGERLDLSFTDLREINFYERKNLSWADLYSADLNSADLSSADLSSANLHSADLNSADLNSADLSSADLISADLSSADLSSANLYSADLRSADLRWADLRWADLSSAGLRSANLYLAKGLFSFQAERHQLIYYKYNNEYYIQVGCINKSLEHMQKNFKEIGKKNDYTKDEINLYGDIINLFSKYEISEE